MIRTSSKEKILIWILVLSFLTAVANAGLFTINSQQDFDQGTYSRTYYNTTNNAIQLHTLSGNYTSKIFGANRTAEWNNINWSTEEPSQINLFIIGDQKAVFYSTTGQNWTTQTTDYGGSTAIQGVAVTSYNELILLNNKDIYYSSDNGQSWTKINDNFNPDNHNGKVLTIDYQDNLYIIDDHQKVFKSTNKGYNWTEINSDFNPANKDAIAITIDGNNQIFAVDTDEDIFSSSNQGINWTFIANYGGANADGITADQNNYLYILKDSDVYRSLDSGLNWTKINDDFSPYSQNGIIIFFDKKNSLLIADANGRIFQSTDRGMNWTEIGDCNGESNSDPKAGTAILYATNITALARSCDDANCTEETFTFNLSVQNNRYFQYKFEFETNNINYSPKLYNVSIEYNLTPDTTPPILFDVNPTTNSSVNTSQSIEISVNATDDISIDTVFATITYPNSTTTQIILTKIGTTDKYNNRFTIPLLFGRYNITFFSNDTANNINNTETTYFVMINTTPPVIPDTTPPTVLNITPLAGTNFSLNSIVDITVNVTDNVAVDMVFANITNPDLSIVWLELVDSDFDNVYNNSVLANQPGWYYITIIANDTSGNINNTERTHFDPASLGGRGGGGGGGGAAYNSYKNLPDWKKEVNTEIIRPTECVESWLCDSWTPCNSEGKQARTCEDYYTCGTEKTKPIIEQDCGYKINELTGNAIKEVIAEKPSQFAVVTKVFTRAVSIPLIILGIIGISLMIFAIAKEIYTYQDKKQEEKIEINKKQREQLISKLKGVYKL